MKKIKPAVVTAIVMMVAYTAPTACTAKAGTSKDHLSSTSRESMGSYKGEKYQACRIAIAKGDKKQIAEVLDYCNDKLAKEPDDGEIYYIKAMALSQLGDIDNAMTAVIKAVDHGIPFDRFLAGPRNMFAPLTASKKFKKHTARHNIKLIHGPMLGDITDRSVKIWVRTAHESPVVVKYSQNENMTDATMSKSVSSDKDADFTAIVNLTNLKSNTVYYYQIVIDSQPITLDRKLTFTTSPAKGAPAKFKIAFGGGSNVVPKYEYMWDTILSYHPAAMFQLGDNTYFNIPDVAEHQQYFFYRRHSRPEYKRMIASVPVYAIWDDHDFGGNDSIGTAGKFDPYWKHEIVLPQFIYNYNNPYYGGADKNPGCWFDLSIGDVDFFMIDGRYYRTDPQKPDPSMLGAAQLDWLLKKLKASKATFKIIASPVPWAFGTKPGTQKSATFGKVPGAQDTWEGFPDEREKIFSLIEDNKIEGVYLISADRHRSDALRIERPNGYDFYEANTSHLTKPATHSMLPSAIFSILGKPAFGLLTIDTTLTDPQITYDVMKIDGQKAATLTVNLSQLKFQKQGQPETPDLPAFETLSPQKQLPDLLVTTGGDKVPNPDQWNRKRRPEIEHLLRHYMYGYAPAAPNNMTYKIESIDENYFDGKATLKQITITFGPKDAPPINLLLATPNSDAPAPVFLGLNFMGNHTLLDDPSILLPKVWVSSRASGVVNNRANDASRGTGSARWPIEMAIDRGYAVATLYYGDVDPDKVDYSDGVQASYYTDGQTKPAPHEWGSIAAWSWGLSRAVDYLINDNDIDSKRIAVMGHSRNGKAALLAGAMDQRISLIVSNMSGCGGAALSRRRIGETVKKINDRFEHWFNDEFKKFNEKEDYLPLDQHMLIAMLAPRPVLVASATGDKWADPEGEFLALKAANPVYQLLGTDTLTAEKFPDENTLIGNTQGYHIRPGKHGVGAADWNVFMDFADKHFKTKFAAVENLPVQKGMPDPFLMSDGRRVQSPEDWDNQRQYIKEMLQHYLYGTIPPLPKNIQVEQTGSRSVYDGAGVEENYTLTIQRNDKTASCRFLVVRPALKKHYPAIIKNDVLPFAGTKYKKSSHDSFDPGLEAVQRGYLLCRFHRTDLASDSQKDGRKAGVYPLYPQYDFGALAVWGWGHGLVLSALDQLSLADTTKVVATGHSRGGKAALCAGIYDDRVTITAPNSSGTGGTGSMRYFEQGQKPQTIGGHIGKNEHWFGPRHFQFSGSEDRMPYDSHFALASIAPRAFVNCHARQDYWANPYGTELTHRAAKIVYQWMGVKDDIGLHWRDGGHDQGQKDWTALLDFADRYFFGKTTNLKYDDWTYPNAQLPFKWKAPKTVPAIN